MKRGLLVIPALLLIPGVFMAGCSAGEKDSVDYYRGEVFEDSADMTVEEEAGLFEIGTYNELQEDVVSVEADIQERIIKKGMASFVSDDVEAKADEINEVVREYEGDIKASSLRRINDRERATLTIRIKSNLFDAVYDILGEVDDLVSIESTSEDVTMEYVDLHRRLEVYRTQEERYLDMLNSAENIEEMLKVEKELGRIRLEIESIEGRLNYFNSVTDYSYIDIIVEQRKAVASAARTPDNIWEEFLFSFTEGWRFFFAMVVSIAASLIWGLPFLMLTGLIILLIVMVKKRVVNRR